MFWTVYVTHTAYTSCYQPQIVIVWCFILSTFNCSVTFDLWSRIQLCCSFRGQTDYYGLQKFATDDGCMQFYYSINIAFPLQKIFILQNVNVQILNNSITEYSYMTKVGLLRILKVHLVGTFNEQRATLVRLCWMNHWEVYCFVRRYSMKDFKCFCISR